MTYLSGLGIVVLAAGLLDCLAVEAGQTVRDTVMVTLGIVSLGGSGGLGMLLGGALNGGKVRLAWVLEEVVEDEPEVPVVEEPEVVAAEVVNADVVDTEPVVEGVVEGALLDGVVEGAAGVVEGAAGVVLGCLAISLLFIFGAQECVLQQFLV